MRALFLQTPPRLKPDSERPDENDQQLFDSASIDSAAVGLVPRLIHDFRTQRPDVEIRLFEEKTIRLLPQLLSGRIDLALVRPPEVQDKRLEFLFLLNETPVVAFPERHAFARRSRVLNRRLGRSAINRSGAPLASAQPRPHNQIVCRGPSTATHRAICRRKANDRKFGGRKPRRCDRSSLDVAYFFPRRLLRSA